MKKPDIPFNETTRLELLDELGIIYSPAEERFDQITMLACRLFDVPIALVSLVTSNNQWFKSVQGLLVSETSREVSFCAHAILDQDTFIVSDTLLNPDFVDNPLVTGDPNIRFYAGQPITYEGVNLGTLCIIDSTPHTLKPSEIETLRTLASWVENEIKYTALSKSQFQLVSDLDEARREAMIDPLTKLWNRRGLEQLLVNETERAKREKASIAIMLIDMDSFKTINDEHRHTAGDAVLKEVARRIRSSVRPNDVVARYGGDEFFVFLANCPEEIAKTTAKRILERIRDETIEVTDFEITTSVSIGVSTTVALQNLDIDNFIHIADVALYKAKDAGRNCVELIAND